MPMTALNLFNYVISQIIKHVNNNNHIKVFIQLHK